MIGRHMHLSESSLLASECHICGDHNIKYKFMVGEHSLYQCAGCGFMFLNPQPSDEFLSSLYTSDYFLMGADDLSSRRRSEMKKATALLYLKQLIRYYGSQEGKLLEIGCGNGDFLLAAKQTGFAVQGIEVSESATKSANDKLGVQTVQCGTVEDIDLPDGCFDVCALFDVVEHVRHPIKFLNRVHRLLAPGGVLFIVTPSLGSWSARLMKNRWMEFKPEHLHYFDTETIQNALCKSGFHEINVNPNHKYLQIEYIRDHFRKYPVPFYSKAINAVARFIPSALKTNNIKYSTSGMNILCRKTQLKETPVLSVVVPAYNEAKTFRTMMQSLLEKDLRGIKKEIIVVESNSTDGTRQEVQKFSNTPGVITVFEDRPQGKGHAVRSGLAHAGGEFIIIQDADLEYDLNDYDQLLAPLLKHQKAFVLGSRHTGDWKMREFSEQKMSACYFNMGHVFFRGLLNLLYGQSMKDPFTMYKVFRADCLYGLQFECNRFDFDIEIVIKLIRKGYSPLEIPVNYRSRSFKEGKKVLAFRDPLTWIWAIAKYRFSSAGAPPPKMTGK
jgi:2-polyprenyl-3-methyl-5-hydroxy-6-metoxy-1,4-benzoquinol methylase